MSAVRLAAGDPARRLGAGPRQPVHGPLLGARPRAAAAVHGHGPGRVDARSIGLIEGVAEATALVVKVFSGRALRPVRAAQAAGRPRLRPRGGHQARLSAGALAVVDRRCALRRPHRQGHPRRAARRADRRHRAGRTARCELRVAPGAGHRGRLRRAAAGAGRNGVVRRQLPGGVLGGRRARGARGAAAGRRGRGTAARRRRPPRASRACSGAMRAACRATTGSSSPSRRC